MILQFCDSKCGQPRKTLAGITPECERSCEAYGATQDGMLSWSGGSGGATKSLLWQP